MASLHQLFYVSNRKPQCTDEEITKILASAQKNNSHLDVTGVLLHTEGKFVQYLEGTKEKLESLYDLIKKDERHSNVILLGSFSLEKRLFPNWQMGFKNVTNQTFAFHTDISSDEQKQFEGILNGKVKTDIFLTNFIKRVSALT